MAARAQLRLIQPDESVDGEDGLPADRRADYQRELVEGFIVSRRATVSDSMVQLALTAVRGNFVPWLEAHGRYVWNATPEDLDRWAVGLRNSVKARTHQQYFIHVDRFYAWLVTRRAAEIRERLGVEVRNPVDAFNRARRLPEEDRLVPVPREEVVTYFLAASRKCIDLANSDIKWVQACRDYAMWMLFNWSGLRRMEAAALTRDDVDLVAGAISVREGKGGKGRIVHIQPPLAPVLRWYLHDVRPQAACVGGECRGSSSTLANGRSIPTASVISCTGSRSGHGSLRRTNSAAMGSGEPLQRGCTRRCANRASGIRSCMSKSNSGTSPSARLSATVSWTTTTGTSW